MQRRIDWGLVVLLALAAGLRFVELGSLALTGDESYYWLWSERLDWSYFDHPAGVALMVRLSTALGGVTEFGIRWLNAALGVGSVWLIYQLGNRMFSQRAGRLAALALAVGAPFIVTSRIVYTDSLHLFALLLNLYWLWSLIESPDWGTAVAFGLSLALAFNTKYPSYLYALAVGAAILLYHRPILGRREWWFGLALGITGLLPTLGWNAKHDWGSFGWQLEHATQALPHAAGLTGRLGHAVAYLSWPLVVVALIGIGSCRSSRKKRAGRLLGMVATALLLPILLGPADSPRNLTTGLTPLLLLAGTAWSPTLVNWRAWAARAMLVTVMALLGLYGLGTVTNLIRETSLPQSSIVPDLKHDSAGWRELAPQLAGRPGILFAVDYSVAAQLTYYARRPVYTAWSQYQIWGIPQLETTTVISLNYLDERRLTAQLGEAFETVEGPEHMVYGGKEVRIWKASGLRWEMDQLLDALDFLHLLEATY
jgi:4-amino-4-deoxy-L-arabinose transferase-like glycosyltransferase